MDAYFVAEHLSCFMLYDIGFNIYPTLRVEVYYFNVTSVLISYALLLCYIFISSG